MSSAVIQRDSQLHLELNATWQSSAAHHQETMHFEAFNFWRDGDLLPAPFNTLLSGQSAGFSDSHTYSAGQLTPAWQERLCRRVNASQFNRHFRRGMVIEPAEGRFYPRGIVSGLPDSFSETITPLRLLEVNREELQVDLNSPLSRTPITLTATVHAVETGVSAVSGRCRDAVEELLGGVGIQARRADQRPTPFLQTPEALRRGDEQIDTHFYATTRLIDHLDRRTLSEITTLYGQLIPSGSRVLDLMASWDSHLPDSLSTTSVSGLGMNREELAANPRLSDFICHDLNADPRLPYPDSHFDAVITTASIEYLTQPEAVAAEVARVLTAGGLWINTFSNRWFPSKAIQIWSLLHDFERIGLVSEYYLAGGHFTDLQTRSIRGLSRPATDRYASQIPHADPLYAVWGRRSSPSL